MKPAAVFDQDGTLIRGTSAERLLLRWLVKERVIGAPQIAAAVAKAATLPWAGYTEAFRRNKLWISGVPVDELRVLMSRFLDETLTSRWCAPVLERLEELRAKGVTPYLLSGAPDFIANPVGERLRMERVVATPMEVVDGRYTGHLGGTHVFSGAKLDRLNALAREEELDLAASWGFADHLSDVSFLSAFGRATVVDPVPALRKIARSRGWEVVG